MPDSYWINKLGAFRQGTTLLPNITLTRDDSGAAGLIMPAPSTDAALAEILALGALTLVVGRYNGGEPLLTVTPPERTADGFVFVAQGIDESRTAGVFLESLRRELTEARRQEPASLDAVASGLGLDTDQARALLRLAFAFGPVAGAALVSEHAEVLLHAEPRGAQLWLDVSLGGAIGPTRLSRQLTEHVARAIAWLAANPGSPLSAFDLLSADERRRVAHDFNATRVALPEGETLHGLVNQRAALTPDAPAVIYQNTALSYRALDGQANQLAVMLQRDFGVAAGARVGVMMERSEQTIVALYGVMKAGAAYVPINPRHPWDTVRYMLENAGISVLIVDSESIAAASNFGGRLLVIDMELRGRPAAADPAVPVAGGDLAYVIYTSGSTGKPKGVAVEHRAIVNTVLWRNAFYGIGPADVNLQIPSFAFDSSVVDIFCVLAAGGTLVLPEESMRLDARRLIALSAARGVTSCIVTPSYYNLLVTELHDTVPTLRWITLAGESATPQLVAAHLERLPGVALFNEYGPTENAVCSTACRLDRVEPTVTIGGPIWNVAVLILDPQGRLCPVGAPGELYLGGAGLARGYLNQDQLTADRFVASPIPGIYDGRLYRTGDRGCWRDDGTIEFLGRLDSQVKIRGFRIELDDVELALLRHPGLRNAAVICKEDLGGAKYLAAYAETHAGVLAPDLREHMRRHVPHYMVPDVVAVLPRLPLNLNGKVDRTALRAVDDFTAAVATAQATAVSPIEEALLTLWAEVLKRGQISLEDNFFSIGGNSLRVMELTSRIRSELSIDVELLDLYTYPTIPELAERLTGLSEERRDAKAHGSARHSGI